MLCSTGQRYWLTTCTVHRMYAWMGLSSGGGGGVGYSNGSSGGYSCGCECGDSNGGNSYRGDIDDGGS